MFPTFADILPVTQLSSHSYSVELSKDWCIGDVPNGGYITSAFLVVARTHMQITHKARSEPHPINLHLEFFRRTSASTARFSVKDVKLGARISNLHLTLSQQQSGAQWVDEIEGYITMSNLANEQGVTLPTAYQLHPPPFPVDLDALASTGDDKYYSLRRVEPFPSFRRAGRHCQMHLVRPEMKPVDRPKSIVDQWIRFYPHRQLGRWTNDAFGYIVDIFPQIVEQYVNPHLEDKADHAENVNDEKLREEPRAKYWYPTLVLNLDVKKLLPPEGVEWLFVRIQAKAILNGRFDLDVEIFGVDGELVALSTHASLVVDATRNLSKRKNKI